MYRTITEYRDGERETLEFGTEREAIAYAKRECRWELTMQSEVVHKGEYIHIEQGDYSSFA